MTGGVFLTAYGKPDSEPSAPFRLVLCCDCPPQLVDDIAADRQAQSRPPAGFLGGKKGLPYFFEYLGLDSWAVVFNSDLNVFNRAAGNDNDLSAGPYSIKGIFDNIQKRLLYLCSIGSDGGQRFIQL